MLRGAPRGARPRAPATELDSADGAAGGGGVGQELCRPTNLIEMRAAIRSRRPLTHAATAVHSPVICAIYVARVITPGPAFIRIIISAVAVITSVSVITTPVAWAIRPSPRPRPSRTEIIQLALRTVCAPAGLFEVKLGVPKVPPSLRQLLLSIPEGSAESCVLNQKGFLLRLQFANVLLIGINCGRLGGRPCRRGRCPGWNWWHSGTAGLITGAIGACCCSNSAGGGLNTGPTPTGGPLGLADPGEP